MIKRSGIQGGVKKTGKSASKTPLVPMVFEVTPEVKARLEKCARRANMSVSEAAGVILEFQMNKQDAIEQSIREKVAQAFDEELDRIESLVAPFLSSPLPPQGKGKKKFSN